MTLFEEEGLRIRTASVSDAKDLLAIYGPYVEKTAISFEYEVPGEAEFAERIRNIMVRFPYLVAEDETGSIGYAYCGIFHAREAYNHSVETSIYVDRSKKGRGIGRRLYQVLEQCLMRQHVINLYACIAHTDLEDETLTKDSMHFHAHMGYELKGRFDRCGYKFGRWYNMIYMEKMLGEHGAHPEPFIPFNELKYQEF